MKTRPRAPAAERQYRWADSMRLSVYDENGGLVATADLDPAHPLLEGPDGAPCGHAIGHFIPGSGFERIRPMLDAFKEVFNAGDAERALAMSDAVDALGFWATDPQGRRFPVSNVQFNPGWPSVLRLSDRARLVTP